MVSGDSYPSATLIEGNTIHDNADDGIDTWNTRDNRVIGNVCYNHGDGGDGCGFKLGGGGEEIHPGKARSIIGSFSLIEPAARKNPRR